MSAEKLHYYAAIDFGTTHIKTGVVSSAGEDIMILTDDTPVHQDSNGFYYDPAEISSLVLRQINTILSQYPLEGIGITGMAEAGLMIQRNTGKPLSMIIPWFDKRTTGYAKDLTAAQQQEAFLRTGLRNSFKYGVYKYLWCREHLEYQKQDTMWLSAADFLFYALTGQMKTDPTYAVRTYLYDIRSGGWSAEALKQFTIIEEQLPELVPSGKFSGFYQWQNQQIPVAICGHDHLCAAYGLLRSHSEIFNSCGTAETYIGVMDTLPKEEVRESSGLIYGPFVDGVSYFCMGNLSSSGQSVEWFRTLNQPEALSYDDIAKLLETAGKKPGNVYYFPYLSGVGTPAFQAEAAGGFLGIRAEHTQADLIKAVIEGICYQGRRILDCGYPEEAAIICSGGAVRNRYWMQCKADIANRKIYASERSEGTIYGAIALMCSCNGRSIQCKNNFQEIYVPDTERARNYQINYKKYYLPASEWIIQMAGQSDPLSEKDT